MIGRSTLQANQRLVLLTTISCARTVPIRIITPARRDKNHCVLPEIFSTQSCRSLMMEAERLQPKRPFAVRTEISQAQLPKPGVAHRRELTSNLILTTWARPPPRVSILKSPSIQKSPPLPPGWGSLSNPTTVKRWEPGTSSGLICCSCVGPTAGRAGEAVRSARGSDGWFGAALPAVCAFFCIGATSVQRPHLKKLENLILGARLGQGGGEVAQGQSFPTTRALDQGCCRQRMVSTSTAAAS